MSILKIILASCLFLLMFVFTFAAGNAGEERKDNSTAFIGAFVLDVILGFAAFLLLV
jgi:hypothetical protein